jgi:hypothetical protein
MYVYTTFFHTCSESLKAAFRAPYVDLAHQGVAVKEDYRDRFIAIVNKNFENFIGTWSYYSAYMPVLQSSGTGKTRLIAEMAKKQWTVYVCFRDEDSSGFPFSSPADVCDRLSSEKNCAWNYFLPATIAVLHGLMKVFCDRSPAELEEADKLEGIFQQVLDYTRQNLNKIFTEYSKTKLTMEKFFNCLVLERQREGDADFSSQFWKTVMAVDANLMATKPVESTAHAVDFTVPPLCQWSYSSRGRHLPLVFAFDEARALLAKEGKNSSFIKLRRSLRIRKLGIFALMLDTNGLLANFTPASHADPSERVASKEWSLFAPYIHVIPADRLIQSLPTCLSEVCDIERLSCMGRPVWVRGAVANEASSVAAVKRVSLASLKLGIKNLSNIDPKKVNDEQAVSLLAPRLHLSVKTERRLATNLVACHLANLELISEERITVTASYLSEPVVVAACFEQWKNAELLYHALEQVGS